MDPNDQQQSGGVNQQIADDQANQTDQTGQVPDQPYGGAPVQEPFQTPVTPETPASQPTAPVNPEPVGQVPTGEPVSQPTTEVPQPTQPTSDQPGTGDSQPPQAA